MRWALKREALAGSQKELSRTLFTEPNMSIEGVASLADADGSSELWNRCLGGTCCCCVSHVDVCVQLGFTEHSVVPVIRLPC